MRTTIDADVLKHLLMTRHIVRVHSARGLAIVNGTKRYTMEPVTLAAVEAWRKAGDYRGFLS